MAIACNQICQWNDSSDGCVKPVGRICPMSNMPSKQKTQTNADRIRAMSDEELARECVRQFPMYLWPTEVRTIYFDFEKPNKNNAINAWIEWLKKPAE